MTGVKAGGNTFPIGSIFSLNIPFSKDTKDKHAIQITLAPGSCLKFNAVHLLPPHDLGSCCTIIYFRTEENTKPMALATFSPEAHSHQSLAGLEVCGPRTIRLWLDSGKAHVSADLIGSVVSDPNNTLSSTPTSTPTSTSTSTSTSTPTPTPTPAFPSESVTPSSTPTSTNKKKQIENSNHNENDKKEETAKEAEEEALNEKKRKHELHEQKKARKKLAQEKKEQLRHVINEQQGYPENDNDDDNDNDTKKEKEEEESKKSKKKGKSVSVYSDRRLAGGIVVKDMLIGDGSQVKLGKRASILYTGSFPDGKVFDKNQNKHAPLQFRVGTGEVIRGLERGLEGMRVGGERTITIPPHLGYGKKGSGKVIPKNSTLVFHVKLIGVGSAVNTA